MGTPRTIKHYQFLVILGSLFSQYMDFFARVTQDLATKYLKYKVHLWHLVTVANTLDSISLCNHQTTGVLNTAHLLKANHSFVWIPFDWTRSEQARDCCYLLLVFPTVRNELLRRLGVLFYMSWVIYNYILYILCKLSIHSPIFLPIIYLGVALKCP